MPVTSDQFSSAIPEVSGDGGINAAPVLLVVDDDAAQRRALCTVLGLEGYQAQGCENAAAALKHLREHGAALLLTDLMMPDIDGLALLQQARQVDPQVAGIVMTGHGAIDSAVRALQEGAQDYLLKPFKPAALLLVIERALESRRLRIENEAMRAREAQHLAALEAANEDLESFVYSVSHDLRAPLRAIRGFCSIYLEDYGAQTPPAGRELLDKVVDGAARMDRLIDALLQLSRCSRQPLSCTGVAMDELTRHIFQALVSECPQRCIRFRSGDLPVCHADPALIEQVLINLLGNAIKFTRSCEEAVIEVDCAREPQEFVFTVRDNGVGFDMKYSDKLFAVFQRLHPQTQFEGTGVGLSIVQRIIQRHGGRVWAQGAAGQGACFHFTVPVAETVPA